MLIPALLIKFDVRPREIKINRLYGSYSRPKLMKTVAFHFFGKTYYHVMAAVEIINLRVNRKTHPKESFSHFRINNGTV